MYVTVTVEFRYFTHKNHFEDDFDVINNEVEAFKLTCLETKLWISHQASQVRQHAVEKRDKCEERDEHGGYIGDQRDGR